MQSSYTFSKSEDTTQASTFFSDATNGTTSALPEFIPGYNKGLSDFDIRHNWVLNAHLRCPSADLTGVTGASSATGACRDLDDEERQSAHGLRARRTDRGRSGLRRGARASGRIVRLRSRLRPGQRRHGNPDQWFDPAAFVLQPAGTFGTTGRGDFIGPNLRTLDLALAKTAAWARLGGRLEFRVEAFNVLNRANFGVPSCAPFAGARDGAPVLATFGRITNTVTSARQIQLGGVFGSTSRSRGLAGLQSAGRLSRACGGEGIIVWFRLRDDLHELGSS